MFLQRNEVVQKIEEAIVNRKILSVKYQHVSEDDDIVDRKMAPFDVGTTNPKKVESNKDNVYLFCYDHIDKKNDIKKPIVHAINIKHILSIEETGENFDENELADINLKNIGYDYREYNFVILPDRGWFKK